MTAGATTDPSAYVERLPGGESSLNLLVDGVHCAHCIDSIENSMMQEPGVVGARVNLSTRRMTVSWRDGAAEPAALVRKLETLGYRPVPYDPAALDGRDRRQGALLLRCLGVAGFAAGNAMLLSVSVWAGAFSGMAPSTRSLMHWATALIVLPAIAYAGLPFFRSACAALSARRLNMDVPISLAILVTAGISLSESLSGGPHAYFDAAIMLLFFLLIGRYLDFRARGAMRATAENLVALSARPAVVVEGGGRRRFVPARLIPPGATVLVAAGERLPVDGTVESGNGTVDQSLLTGESEPVAVRPSTSVYAGTVNLGAALVVRATKAGDATVLAEMARFAEDAGRTRSAYVRLADRAARIYAPAVHGAALFAFAGWWLAGGLPVHDSLLIAAAVLIVTCPCALGLAVPAVQVAASGALLKRGILVKGGDALERLAVVDAIVLDKTGTLTLGRPEIVDRETFRDEDLADAAALAAASAHPLCRAVARAAGACKIAADVEETPGSGLEAIGEDGPVRLGSRVWCAVRGEDDCVGTELWLRRPRRAPVRFRFADRFRPDAAALIDWLRGRGFLVELLSGDRPQAVASAAEALGIKEYRAEADPVEKGRHLAELRRQGHRVLMIGDGLNDAPSLAAAHASISPATGSDVAQTAADFVFQGERLESVAAAIVIARRARRLALQNFALAAGYNLFAVPLAIAGLVTPLVAACAMSASSLVVILNALRAARYRERPFA